MLRGGNIYTVHENPDAVEPADRIELVREGYSVWAFLFTFIWLLAERLWLAFFVYLLALGLVIEGGSAYGLSEISIGCLQFMLQLLLGFHAHDLQRAKLARKGYVMTGVVAAESALLAHQRAHHHPAIVL